jgi:hypothetical protein
MARTLLCHVLRPRPIGRLCGATTIELCDRRSRRLVPVLVPVQPLTRSHTIAQYDTLNM